MCQVSDLQQSLPYESSGAGGKRSQFMFKMLEVQRELSNRRNRLEEWQKASLGQHYELGRLLKALRNHLKLNWVEQLLQESD